MAKPDIDENTKRGLDTAYTSTGAYNALDFALNQKLRNDLQTSFIARIDSCTSTGAGAGSGTVNATQLTAQSDARGNSLPMPSIPALPHYRVQAGIAALVIDPVPGDIGIFSACKQDISGVKQGTAAPVPAGSFRTFSQSDSVMTGTIHTKAPKVWIEIKQDQTIVIHAPAGVKIETDQSVQVTAGASVDINAPAVNITGAVTVKGSITSTGDVSAGGISAMHHTHPGDSGGSTGAPR